MDIHNKYSWQILAFIRSILHTPPIPLALTLLENVPSTCRKHFLPYRRLHLSSSRPPGPAQSGQTRPAGSAGLVVDMSTLERITPAPRGFSAAARRRSRNAPCPGWLAAAVDAQGEGQRAFEGGKEEGRARAKPSAECCVLPRTNYVMAWRFISSENILRVIPMM